MLCWAQRTAHATERETREPMHARVLRRRREQRHSQRPRRGRQRRAGEPTAAARQAQWKKFRIWVGQVSAACTCVLAGSLQSESPRYDSPKNTFHLAPSRALIRLTDSIIVRSAIPNRRSVRFLNPSKCISFFLFCLH